MKMWSLSKIFISTIIRRSIFTDMIAILSVCMYLWYLDRVAQFSLKSVLMGVCVNNDKARLQHR